MIRESSAAKRSVSSVKNESGYVIQEKGLTVSELDGSKMSKDVAIQGWSNREQPIASLRVLEESLVCLYEGTNVVISKVRELFDGVKGCWLDFSIWATRLWADGGADETRVVDVGLFHESGSLPEPLKRWRLYSDPLELRNKLCTSVARY